MVLVNFFDKTMIFKAIEIILLSNIKIFGAFIPISIGVIEREEDIKKKVFLYVLSLVTVAIRFSVLTSLQFLSGVIVITVINQILLSLGIKNKNVTYIALFVSVFFNDVIWNLFDNILVYDYIVAAIKGCSVILGYILFSNLDFSSKELTEGNMLISVTFLGIMLMGLGELKIFSLNLRNIISVIAILTLAMSSGVKYSAVAGLILGTMNELSNPNMGTAIISFSLGGMIAGLLKERGKATMVWGFLLGNSILAYYITGYNALIIHYLEIIIAGSIFYVMNKKEIMKFKIFEKGPELLYEGCDRKATIKDLEDSSSTFYSISELIDDIDIDEDKYDLFDEIKDDICFNCDKYDECWNKEYDETMDKIFDAIEFLEEENSDEAEDILLEDFCSNGKEILNKIRFRYDEYKSTKDRGDIKEIKNCVSEQFRGFSQYITEIKQKFVDDSSTSLEKRIVNSFQKENYELEKVDINMLGDQCEIALKAPGDLPKVSFLLAANKILSRLLGKRMLATDEKRELVVFREYKNLRVNSFVVTKKADNESVLGDSYKIVNSENNKYTMFLSDGMGTGADANKISNSLIELFSKMSRVGLDVGVVTNMLGTFIQHISTSEKIVTLDTLSIDLLTGECQMLKIGGAPTFIIRKNNVEIIYCDTLPLGILDRVDFLQEKRILEPGDIVVSVSDGVVDSKRDLINKEYWISSFLKKIDIDEPEIIAKELLEKTIENYNNNIKDDITIIVSKICE